MTDTTTVDLDADTAALVAHLRRLDTERRRIDEQAEEIKHRLRKTLAAGQRGLDHGVPVVTLQPNRRLDLAKAVELLDPALRDRCATTAYDPKQVKRHLAPALVEVCMVEVGEPKVVLL